MYGEKTTTHVDDTGIATALVEKFIAGKVAKTFVRQSETVHVANDSEALAELLKLMDRQKAGEIHSITFECVPDDRDERRIHRVKMSWICTTT
jgi:hypothetical protein